MLNVNGDWRLSFDARLVGLCGGKTRVQFSKSALYWSFCWHWPIWPEKPRAAQLPSFFPLGLSSFCQLPIGYLLRLFVTFFQWQMASKGHNQITSHLKGKEEVEIFHQNHLRWFEKCTIVNFIIKTHTQWKGYRKHISINFSLKYSQFLTYPFNKHKLLRH